MTIIINLLGLALIAFVIWWFWLSQTMNEKTASNGAIEITVDNGIYIPATIRCKVGKPITLRFIRKDPNPCAEMVIFSDLNISAQLATDQPHDITITPKKPGEYEFTCQMAMYRGKLIAEK